MLTTEHIQRKGLRRRVSWAFALLLLSCVACGATDGRAGTGAASIAPDAKLYVSMGDSYAAGYQPDGHGGGATTRDGFAYQVLDSANSGGLGITLANYGCTGVTSTTMVSDPGCAAAALGPGAPAYPDQTQAAAALDLMRQHPGAVRLVTIAIGGNDVGACVQDRAPQTCVEQKLPVLRRNLDGLLTAVRSTVGESVPVVGVSYADVYLGLYLKRDAASTEAARRSLVLFRSYLNPMLAQVYAAHGAKFVDTTALTGAYGSFSDTEQLAPYGALPVPVARVCSLTWFCQVGDVHPNRQGHALIAAAVLKAAQS